MSRADKRRRAWRERTDVRVKRARVVARDELNENRQKVFEVSLIFN